MDSHVILDAIGMIDDQHIVSAQKRFGCEFLQTTSVPQGSSCRRIRSRAFISIAAAVMLLISSFVTAMAVSEDFREKVFEFFHISTAEDVPDSNSVNPERVELGGKVLAEYLNVGKELTLIGNGTMYDAKYDQNGNVCGASFYKIADGTLQTVPTSVTEFQLMVNSIPVNGVVYWCSANNGISAIGNGDTADQSRTWSISTIAQRSDVVLLSVFGGIADNLDFHAFLLDLHTGTVQPIFSETGLCKLTHVQDIQLTADCKYALVLGKTENELEATPYLYDLQSAQLISLQEKVGEKIEGNAFLIDDNTVLLTSRINNQYSCWSYSIPEATMQKTVDRLPVDSSNADVGKVVAFESRYALCVYENGTMAVIDQKNGLSSPVINDFIYDNHAEILVSADGGKACYYVSAKPYDSLNVETLGVIDFNSARFTAFDRSGFEKNQEWRLGWIDNNKVSISVVGSQSDLYVYEFE